MEKFIYLPTAVNGHPEIPEVQEKETVPERPGIYPCPCCGNLTYPVPVEEAVAYICPVCFWENDVFISSDTEPSDENSGMTLRQARENYQQMGACAEWLLPYVRKPQPDEIHK